MRIVVKVGLNRGGLASDKSLCQPLPRGIGLRLMCMTMIAYITINSGLVPLIEGLCVQILHLRFGIIGGLCSHLLLFVCRRKNTILKEKAVSPRRESLDLNVVS